jgi:hypothetical protein
MSFSVEILPFPSMPLRVTYILIRTNHDLPAVFMAIHES